MSSTIRRSAQMRQFIAAIMEPVELDPDPVAAIQYHLRELAKAMRAVHPEVDRYDYNPEHGFAIVASGMKRGIKLDEGDAS